VSDYSDIEARRAVLRARFPVWAPVTLSEFLHRAAAEYGDRPFVLTDERTASYAEVDAWADELADGLAALGVRAGDRVGMLMANYLEFVPVKFAIARAGAVAIREATSWLQTCVQGLLSLQVPVIASVHGYAAGGGGFGLVCASDLVIAGESAKFLAGATRVGMAPDAGVSVTLPLLVGLRKAMEIILTNPVLTAAEALQLGLITRVVPDDVLATQSLELARSLACGATGALGAAKRLVWSGLGARVEAQLPEEARTVAELSGTADAREGLAAVIERRVPRFRGR
jgi:enoyl-CoA hydratase/carnithine racemase